ncbi:hypothetical protein K439DRAFT_1643234 [Ramaria rubella]|nr:hypothetical protein K439DRAFT_1643234 [Ramaria rubella]
MTRTVCINVNATIIRGRTIARRDATAVGEVAPRWTDATVKGTRLATNERRDATHNPAHPSQAHPEGATTRAAAETRRLAAACKSLLNAPSTDTIEGSDVDGDGDRMPVDEE